MTKSVKPGELIGQFEIIGELGRGSNGIVFLAEQRHLNRRVALKILNPERAENPGHVTRFFQEAQAAGRLNHPNIVQAIAAGTTEDGLHYLAMELISGQSAEERLAARRGFDTVEVVRIGAAVAGALEHAWTTQRMTHGDIKPDNLMLREDGVLKLTDLGLAEVSGARSQLNAMGTPLYAAPEVIINESDAIDFRADIYSLGITIYELLTGTAPFTGDPDAVMDRHLHSIPIPLERIMPGINPELSALVDRMLAKRPADRPGSWREVREALEKLSASSSGGRKPASPFAGLLGAPLRYRIYGIFGGATLFFLGFLIAALIGIMRPAPAPVPLVIKPVVEQPVPVTAPVEKPAPTPVVAKPAPKPAPKPKPKPKVESKPVPAAAAAAAAPAEAPPPAPKPVAVPAETKPAAAAPDLPKLSIAATPAFFHAARSGQTAEVERMLRSGVAVDSTDTGGYSALMWAAARGHAALVKMLLAENADPTLRDKIGQTALDLCGDDPEIARMIRARLATWKKTK